LLLANFSASSILSKKKANMISWTSSLPFLFSRNLLFLHPFPFFSLVLLGRFLFFADAVGNELFFLSIQEGKNQSSLMLISISSMTSSEYLIQAADHEQARVKRIYLVVLHVMSLHSHENVCKSMTGC